MAGNSRIYFILFFLILSACAKPNYQDVKLIPQALSALCFSQTPLCTNITWESKPTETTMGSFVFHFFQTSAPDVYLEPSHKVSVVLWMPSMSHGSSPVTVDALPTGEYRASRVFFIMPGLWEIHIQLKDENDHVVDEVIQNITI